MIKTARKLALRSETVHSLRPPQLAHLRGGDGDSTHCAPLVAADDTITEGYTLCPTAKPA